MVIRRFLRDVLGFAENVEWVGSFNLQLEKNPLTILFKV